MFKFEIWVLLIIIYLFTSTIYYNTLNTHNLFYGILLNNTLFILFLVILNKIILIYGLLVFFFFFIAFDLLIFYIYIYNKFSIQNIKNI